MDKKIVSLLLVLILIGCLGIGCNSAEAAQQVTIRIITSNSGSMTTANVNKGSTYTYNPEYNIKLQLVSGGSGNKVTGGTIIANSTATYRVTSSSPKTATWYLCDQKDSYSVPRQVTARTGMKVSELGTPTRSNHVFVGWSTSSDGSTGILSKNATLRVTGTSTLYAIWDKINGANYGEKKYTYQWYDLDQLYAIATQNYSQIYSLGNVYTWTSTALGYVPVAGQVFSFVGALISTGNSNAAKDDIENMFKVKDKFLETFYTMAKNNYKFAKIRITSTWYGFSGGWDCNTKDANSFSVVQYRK